MPGDQNLGLSSQLHLALRASLLSAERQSSRPDGQPKLGEDYQAKRNSCHSQKVECPLLFFRHFFFRYSAQLAVAVISERVRHTNNLP